MLQAVEHLQNALHRFKLGFKSLNQHAPVRAFEFRWQCHAKLSLDDTGDRWKTTPEKMAAHVLGVHVNSRLGKKLDQRRGADDLAVDDHTVAIENYQTESCRTRICVRSRDRIIKRDIGHRQPPEFGRSAASPEV